MKPLFVTDFDGTINMSDVSFLLLNTLTGGVWHGIDQDFISGKIGSMEAYTRISKFLRGNKERWLEEIRKLENVDPAFSEFMKEVKRRGWKVIIVSDGFDVYIKEIMRRNNIRSVEFYANKVKFYRNRVKIEFPYSSRDCSDCGVCKRDIVMMKRKEGYYPIIYVGDGYSDRCGAFYADWVFARRRLSRIFISKRKGFSYLKNFSSLIRWFSNKIRTVIFDLDGTLLDSYPAILKSLKETLEHFGLKVYDDEYLKEKIGIPLKDLLKDFLKNNDLAEKGKEIFRERYMENYRFQTKLLYGARATLKHFKNKGYKIGVISNKHDVFVNLILKWKKLMKYVDVSMGENKRVPPKPNPFMINSVLQITETERDEAIMVGDTKVDIESARRAGVECASVATGSESPEVLYSAKPFHFLFTLKDFAKMMKIREELWRL